MKLTGTKETPILLAGDFFFLFASLWATLFLRNLSLPSPALFSLHLLPFTFLFLVWISIFYIAGLYGRHTVILRSKLPGILLNTQIINSIIAVVFFYFVPFFGITPKTILFIYLLISFVAVLMWRMYGYFILGQRRKDNAILIGSGSEMKELFEEVNGNSIYSLRFVTAVDLSRSEDKGFWDEIVSRIYSEEVSFIAIDLSHEKVEPVLPHLYNLIFSKVSFIDMHKVYEGTFNRVPLSLLKYNWFLENISTTPRAFYDVLKRIMDIVVSIPLLLVPLLAYPLVFLATKLEDGGNVFIHQERIGKDNKTVRIVKFRSMSANDEGKYGEKGATLLKVTKVGTFLRKSRLDEFPQLWNVLKGDISLIGPRPELAGLVGLYTKEIPYYNVRHIIKPGLSGWAQVYGEHPHHGTDVPKTQNKLSYDLYYIKNRSFFLDLKIALFTIRTLLSRVGA